mgnify:CR=1 FL=1
MKRTPAGWIYLFEPEFVLYYKNEKSLVTVNENATDIIFSQAEINALKH